MERTDFKEFLIVNQIRVPHKFIDRSIFVAGFFGALATPSAMAAAVAIQVSPDKTLFFINLSAGLVVLAYVGLFCALSSLLRVIYRTTPVIYRMAHARSWQEFWDRLMCWRAGNRVHACRDCGVRADCQINFNAHYRRVVKRWGNMI